MKHKEMYGISRMDCDKHHTHAWRVSLSRNKNRFVRNFPDRKFKGKGNALLKAKLYRDQIVANHPPMTPLQYCDIKRKNNNSGTTGVYRYAKPYKLRDGTIKESWYWEANWPDAQGQSVSVRYSVKVFGESQAKHKALCARRQALNNIDGIIWSVERAMYDRT